MTSGDMTVGLGVDGGPKPAWFRRSDNDATTEASLPKRLRDSYGLDATETGKGA